MVKRLRVRETLHDLIDLLPPLERKAFDIISSKSREGGIPQVELWKLLGIDSREGSKIVLKLMRRGLVVRKEIEFNGKKAYVLTLPGHIMSQDDFSLPVNIESVLDIPCFTCPYLSICASSADEPWRRCDKIKGFVENARRS